ncbi:MAG: DUF2194 domain-containing protein [Clostridia bacterium]|nr:DUF2194 domain-containing protein [Clostridia bacterium]
MNFRYKGIIAVVLVFALISVVLLLERSGIRFNYEKRRLDFLPTESIVTKAAACEMLEKDTLVLYDSTKADCIYAYRQFEVMLSDMKIGYELVDLSVNTSYDFANYEAVIILLNDLSLLGDNVFTLCDWVHGGGSAMLAMTLEKNIYSSVIENKLGIAESSYSNAIVDSIYVEDGFMVGGGRAFEISDAYDSGLAVQLSSENVKVYAYTNDERKLPLIWEAKHGDGRFVVDNFGLYEKVMRGFFAASYSLMTDISVYPVINGSTFYLDDFPSQIPSGNSSYIQRDYKTSIRDFYINIWWPDMMNFADKYGIRYTGLAIECYDDVVDGTTSAAPDKGTFLNFGNMLMRQGGEIGYHGYNHQPLCFDNCHYKGLYDYKTWESYGAMKSAFDELVDFCDELFPEVEMSVYVPPSNLLSKEGRAFLLNEYPNIRTISGIYFEDDDLDFSCTREYDVSASGIVDQPRAVSGCKLESFMKLAVISELNFHFVNNHFTHPDDALDPERGAELGWEKLKFHFDEYLNWVYSSAPAIRNFTGSEMSAAVQRYAAVTVSKEITDDKMILKLGNFYDEAQLMVRFNEKEPIAIDGGKLTYLTGNLYLLEANKDTVTVSIK